MPTCYLTVLQELDENQITELTPMINELAPDDMNVPEALAENAQIRFEDVFDADMPTKMLQWFNAQRVSFNWQWEAYEDKGAGVNFFDADLDEMDIIRMHENAPVLTLTEAMDPDKVHKLNGVLLRMRVYLHDLSLKSH